MEIKLTYEQFKKIVIKEIYSKRRFCPSHQAYGVAASLWREMQSNPSLDHERQKVAAGQINVI